MWDGSAVFCCRTRSVYLCIWSILLGSAVLFPSDSDHSVNTISARGAAMFVCVCPSLSSACVRWVCIWSTCFSVSYLTLCTDTLLYCTLSLGTDSIAFYSVVEFGFANEWCNCLICAVIWLVLMLWVRASVDVSEASGLKLWIRWRKGLISLLISCIAGLYNGMIGGHWASDVSRI